MSSPVLADASLAAILRQAPAIPPAYVHERRRLSPGPLLITPRAALKWYALHPSSAPVTGAETAAARDAVTTALANPAAETGHGLGFVVHHASTVLEYVLTGVWYQTQELWLTVAVKERGAPASFTRRQPGVDRSTACVWELAPIWHEREAWTRYLRSRRDLPAQYAYLADQAAREDLV